MTCNLCRFEAKVQPFIGKDRLKLEFMKNTLGNIKIGYWDYIKTLNCLKRGQTIQ